MELVAGMGDHRFGQLTDLWMAMGSHLSLHHATSTSTNTTEPTIVFLNTSRNITVSRWVRQQNFSGYMR